MKSSFVFFALVVCFISLQVSGQAKSSKMFREVIGAEEPVLASDSVMDKSFVAPNGDRFLVLEIILDTSVQEVWKLFTDEHEITTWQVARAKMDLRVGGSLRTHYRKNANIGDDGTITLGIMSYIPLEFLTFKVNLTAVFPEKCRNEDKNLQEVLQFTPLSPKRTRITSSMIGWGTGKEWDDVYNLFARGNRWTFAQLIKRFHDGPIEWK